MKRILFSIVFISAILLSGEPITILGVEENFDAGSNGLAKVGDYPFPTNPMNDRAKGYLIQGKVKSAVFNYGNFIQWGDYTSSGYSGHPSGLWGSYTYLPHVSFTSGVAGKDYASNYDWYICLEAPNYVVWCSEDAYYAWYEGGDTNFVTILFEDIAERGVVGNRIDDIPLVSFKNQWGITNTSKIFISLEDGVNPNNSDAYGNPGEKMGIGLVYPWAYRPKLDLRTDEYDKYDYGPDGEEWTEDDEYEYYGANVNESWFTRWSPSTNTDWNAANKARINTHDTEVTAGDIFGDVEIYGVPLTDPDDPYPLLAHSSYSQTWPKRFNEDTGEDEPYWPGWWAEDFDPDLPGCNGSRKDPDCWKDVPGRFISDNDVYMEFDDRWAHRGNRVNSTNTEYNQTGYPMGLRVMAEAHSYGVNYAEDILFVTVKVRNESGDFNAFERDASGAEIPVKDNAGNPIGGEGMIMPDGTKLNRGKGFNYKNVFLGFYFDADAVSADLNGNFGVHSNADDFMEYYFERFKVQDDSLLISMAMIYDYDMNSNGVTDIGIVGVQLLDSPLATSTVDLDLDGIPEIYPGEPLKMTDWHWFDWYNRPGVVERESDGNCCAGEKGRAQASNKEEIQFKLMSGDTTNLSLDEKQWFFHTQYPDTDADNELNPHFDSIDGLMLTSEFIEGSEPNNGLDCVLIMSCGPFDLDVGEEVPFSFTVIFGQNQNDIIKNAKFGQIMYNSHYQGYTPPATPKVFAAVDHNKVVINWEDAAEDSKDVVTGYSDFEGYRVYKSTNGGLTWGDPEDKIYDYDGIHVGWHPLAQYDLTENQDITHCVYSNDDDCTSEDWRGISVAGIDSLAPWIYLGNNTGLSHTYVDTNVIDGIKYTYSVTSYDMGVEADYSITWNDNGDGTFTPDTTDSSSNPDHWSTPWGYPSIETSKGTTIYDPNFVTVIPGYHASNITFPDVTNTREFIIPNEGTSGNYEKYYTIVNEQDLSDKLIRLEIQTDIGNPDTYFGLRTEHPVLYVYEINDKIEQAPVHSQGIPVDSLPSDSLDYFMDLPGTFLDNDILYLPNYMLEYPIINSDYEDYINNWSDFSDGIRLRFDNMPNSLQDAPDDFDPISSIEYHAINNLSETAIFLEFTPKDDQYPYRLNFDYKIEFSDHGITEAAGVYPVDNPCVDNRSVYLPFRVINLTTGKDVGMTLNDKGLFGGDAGSDTTNTGYKDCNWTRNEGIVLSSDSLRIGLNGADSTFQTWDLKLAFDLLYSFQGLDITAFVPNIIYNQGDYVSYQGMIWYASQPIGTTILPNKFIDTDGDGINENPWVIQYPWE
ncbi:MAG: hypothetical protein HQ510_04270, partial [Candidatus Marinimicrobia bacterium]|nr:hypothetical protein [Candidatus Neomarinimicrobiota bacterium]